MIKCQSSEISFLKARIAELEVLRDHESNFMERQAFDRIIYCYHNMLNSILFM